MEQPESQSKITRPTCPACGHEGSRVYINLMDRIFQSKEKWNMDGCLNMSCRTFWLNPGPSKEALPDLYADYSTHTENEIVTEPEHAPKDACDGLLENSIRAYLHYAYGYFEQIPLLPGLLSRFIYLYPSWRDQAQMRVFYAEHVGDGKFLDVGCGQGGNMLMMQALGWKAEGIDFDSTAIAIARKRGLNVSDQDIHSKNYPDGNFDLILLCHVIEHLPDPRETIAECHRILKKGGKLVLITPNGLGAGHRKYGRNWRGLETPQHLQIFNPKSLKYICDEVGFTDIQAFSSPSGDDYVLYQSALLAKNEKIGASDFTPEPSFIKRHLKWFLRDLKGYHWRDLHETAVAICTK